MVRDFVRDSCCSLRPCRAAVRCAGLDACPPPPRPPPLALGPPRAAPGKKYLPMVPFLSDPLHKVVLHCITESFFKAPDLS